MTINYKFLQKIKLIDKKVLYPSIIQFTSQVVNVDENNIKIPSPKKGLLITSALNNGQVSQLFLNTLSLESLIRSLVHLELVTKGELLVWGDISQEDV